MQITIFSFQSSQLDQNQYVLIRARNCQKRKLKRHDFYSITQNMQRLSYKSIRAIELNFAPKLYEQIIE